MGRPGGGGGGRSSGGGHSSGRIGGGHSFGSSRSSGRSMGSRPTGRSVFRSSSRSTSRTPVGGGFAGPVGGLGVPIGGYRQTRSAYRAPVGGGFGGPVGGPAAPVPRGRGGVGCGGGIVAVLVVLCIVCLLFSCLPSESGRPDDRYVSYSESNTEVKSTIAREKLETGKAYVNDCVIDEIGWIGSTSKTSAGMKAFWEETGVQPYFMLKEYDGSLNNMAAKQQWALDYYDANIDQENAFLVVYFAEKDADNDLGEFAYANGKQTSSVMDSEAVEIFWNNIDRYWFEEDLSMDEVVISAFTKTGETIMKVSTTTKDILKWVAIAAAIAAAGATIVVIISKKNKRAKEKAEEDQRILNTPVSEIAKDDLTEKYLKDENDSGAGTASSGSTYGYSAQSLNDSDQGTTSQQ